MSRIGRLPVVVPPHVEVNIEGTMIKVKGPKGSLEYTFPQDISFTLDNGVINVKRPSDDRAHRALHGTTRALIHNMVMGVSTGFERVLEINGVGYRAEVQGKNLVLNLGYSHPIVVEPPDGIAFDVDLKTRQAARNRRHTRVRQKIFGTSTRPRLSVFRSQIGIYAQLIDDEAGNTLA